MGVLGTGNNNSKHKPHFKHTCVHGQSRPKYNTKINEKRHPCRGRSRDTLSPLGHAIWRPIEHQTDRAHRQTDMETARLSKWAILNCVYLLTIDTPAGSNQCCAPSCVHCDVTRSGHLSSLLLREEQLLVILSTGCVLPLRLATQIQVKDIVILLYWNVPFWGHQL